MRRSAALLAVLTLPIAALAQLLPADPDWKETEVPAPPAWRSNGLIPVDVERSSLRWGVDPASVMIGGDGIVRYVAVAEGEGGALNGFYEGLRCSTGEVKVYARHARDGNWVPASGLAWTPVQNPAARHSLAIARAGACVGQAPNTSVAQIRRDLAAPANSRFRNEFR